MNYWLFKSEPDAWSWDQQKKEGAKGGEWDGVRNYQARNVMRTMKKGDLGFFYHSGEEKRIVGVVKVVAEAHPDSTDGTGVWECVDVAAMSDVKRPVTLAEIIACGCPASMLYLYRYPDWLNGPDSEELLALANSMAVNPDAKASALREEK